ncbi:MAG: glycosyltransferase [Deltaproteobacteria bacterium]|nr:glycosyltransferase [Deltaproteobacteria bacterium]
MRVAQVITLFLPEFVGGATLACARVAQGLRARGHEVAIFCGRSGAEASPGGVHEWEVDGVPVTGVDAASGYVALDTRGYRHPEITPHFERFLDRHRPDVVHLHSIQALGVSVLVAAARRVPVVVTVHDWWWLCVRLFLVDPAGFVCAPHVDSTRCHCAPGFDLVARRRELDGALRLAARVLAPSRFLADSMIANGVDAARVEVCPNGVDLPSCRVRRRPGPVRFGYFGGPDNRLKGLSTLLAAAAVLDVGGFSLHLFGVPPAEARTPLTLFDRVVCAPAFAPAALADVLAGLDCLVVPSVMRESYSLVTREALAAGLPVLTSDSGGPQEIVRPGVNGLVFATGDAADLAAQMRRLILEPQFRERLTAGAAATPVPTLATQLDQLEHVYRDVRAAAAHDRPRSAVSPPLRRVLFVSGIDGAPFRYRVTHLRDQLRTRGVASDARYYTDPAIPAAIAAADVIVVSRVPMSPYVAQWLAEARALRRPLVFSCDDLVFDAAATPEDALALLSDDQRAGWRAYTERYAATLRACDAFLGSTEPLVAAAARAGARGVVVRNGLGVAELAVAENARHAAAARDPDDAAVRVAYLSGTIMHDLDFALVEPALAALLHEHPRTRLLLVGYLRTGPALASLSHRIERLPFLSWPRLFATLADVDVNLAPLGADAFSNAKSEVKYLEAAALGIPTVASPTSAFRHAIRHGANGLLAATADTWHAALTTLVADPGLRRRLGNAAHADVCLHASPEAQADRLLAALDGIRAASTARARETSGRAPATSASSDTAEVIGRYDLEPEDALPGTIQPARDGSSPILAPGRAVGQRFRAEMDDLCRIDVCIGSDDRGDAPALTFHVATIAEGTEVAPSAATRAAGALRQARLAAGPVAEDAWLAAEFAPISGSAGRTFYFWVECAEPDSPPRTSVTAVTLRTSTHGRGETPPAGLHLDHRPVAGSLAFRTFHRAAPRADARSRAAAE